MSFIFNTSHFIKLNNNKICCFTYFTQILGLFKKKEIFSINLLLKNDYDFFKS